MLSHHISSSTVIRVTEQVLAGHHLEQSTSDQQAGGSGYSLSALSPSSVLLYPGRS